MEMIMIEQTSRVTTPSDTEIRIERIFNAPRDCVWRATIDPELVAQWWGRGHRLDVEANEVRPGGRWRYVEHAPDGTASGFGGTFSEVHEPDLQVQTFEFDGAPGHVSVQTAHFDDLQGGRTRLTVDVVFPTQEERDGMMQAGMQTGMDESYAALDRLLSKTC